nr:MAG TPA: CobW-like protein [Caudoviricetes sp.]
MYCISHFYDLMLVHIILLTKCDTIKQYKNHI